MTGFGNDQAIRKIRNSGFKTGQRVAHGDSKVMLSMHVGQSANFNHHLPRCQQFQRLRESLIEHNLQLSVGDIAAGHPYQLRGWPVSGDQFYKVTVFADKDDTLLLGGLKYCRVCGIT